MEYSVTGYRENDLARLDTLIGGGSAPPLAKIVPREASHTVGKALCRKLKHFIPRQQSEVPTEAAIGQTIVASATILAMRKGLVAHVLAWYPCQPVFS